MSLQRMAHLSAHNLATQAAVIVAGLVALAALIMSLATPVRADEPAKIALVIGNSAYEKASWRLRNPANDATAVADALRALGFQVDVQLDLDEDGLEDAVRDLRRSLRAAGPDATGLFYYSGHAAETDGINYLVPTDFDGEVLEDLFGAGLRLGQVMEAMDRGEAGSGINLVFLDACRNVPLESATRSAGAGGLGAVEKRPGFLLAFAAAPGMVALDGGDSGNSPFTRALLNRINDPYEVTSLLQFVRGDVADMTGGAQRPWFESGLEARSQADLFYFKRPQANDADAADWARLSDIVPAGLEAYRALYPNGQFAEEALRRLASAGAVGIVGGPPRGFPPEGGESTSENGGTNPVTTPVAGPRTAFAGEEARVAAAIANRLAPYGQAAVAAAAAKDADQLFTLAFEQDRVKYAPAIQEGRDQDAAVALYEAACELGNGRACGELAALATIYEIIPRDAMREADLLRRGCSLGGAQACTQYGLLFWQGSPDAGIAKDQAQSLALMKEGCEKGHGNGCSWVAESYAAGWGTAMNPSEVVRYRKRACEGMPAGWEHVDSCTRLGDMYRTGEGVAQDAAAAEYYYRAAHAIDMQNSHENAAAVAGLAALGLTP